MKLRNIILLLLMMVFSLGFLAAQEGDTYYEPPFTWVSPKIMAQGGSSVAVARGMEALISNPAGLSTWVIKTEKMKDGQPVLDKKGQVKMDKYKPRKGELTLATLTPGLTADFFQVLLDLGWSDGETINMDALTNLDFSALMDPVSGDLDTGAVFDMFAGENGMILNNGIGLQAQLGSMAWTARGLGFGVFASANVDFPQVSNIANIGGMAYATMAAPVGLSLDFNIGSRSNLSFGATAKTMIRARTEEISATSALAFLDPEAASPLDALPVMYGTAMGIDLGAMLSLRSLRFGLAIHDMGNTYFDYHASTGGDLLAMIQDPSADYLGLVQDILSGDYSDQVDDYVIPMSISTGVAWDPDFKGFIGFLMDPVFHAEYVMPTVDSTILGNDPSTSNFVNLKLGAEVATLGGILDLRAGLNSGYLTAGFGVDLLFLEINAALYSTEAGKTAGSKQTMSGVFEVALRL